MTHIHLWHHWHAHTRTHTHTHIKKHTHTHTPTHPHTHTFATSLIHRLTYMWHHWFMSHVTHDDMTHIHVTWLIYDSYMYMSHVTCGLVMSQVCESCHLRETHTHAHTHTNTHAHTHTLSHTHTHIADPLVRQDWFTFVTWLIWVCSRLYKRIQISFDITEGSFDIT